MATQTIPQIQADLREKLGTREAKRLRDAGRIPVVLYGHGEESVHASIDAHEFGFLLQDHAHLIELKLPSGVEPCIIKQVQWDHLGTHVIHLDLTRVNLNEEVTVEVDLEFVGEAPGLKVTGAVLEHTYSTIEIETIASNIPNSVELDVSKLDAGDSLTVADLKLPEGITCPWEPDTVLAHIGIVDEVEEPEAEGEEASEPEVISRGGAEEEEEG